MKNRDNKLVEQKVDEFIEVVREDLIAQIDQYLEGLHEELVFGLERFLTKAKLGFPSVRIGGKLMPISEVSIDGLDLSKRSYGCLYRTGIKTLQDLIGRTENDLMDIRNFGSKSFEEVKEKLEELGFSLKKR